MHVEENLNNDESNMKKLANLGMGFDSISQMPTKNRDLFKRLQGNQRADDSDNKSSAQEESNSDSDGNGENKKEKGEMFVKCEMFVLFKIYLVPRHPISFFADVLNSPSNNNKLFKIRIRANKTNFTIFRIKIIVFSTNMFQFCCFSYEKKINVKW